MPERTEEQKVFQEPVKVTLGGREFDVKPLVIKYSRPWRKKVIDLISVLPKYAQASTNDPDEFAKAMQMLMVECQDQVIDLFFEYAKDLNRDEIEEIATEKDLSDAFEVVIGLAFPLAETLPLVMSGGKIKPQGKTKSRPRKA